MINLAHNDTSLPAFRQGLVGFLELNRSHSIHTVLVEEPCTISMSRSLQDRYELEEQLGKEYGVPVLPLQAYMAGPEIIRSGFVWWDRVHLTSYGQRLVADWLAPKLLDEINGLAKPGAPRTSGGKVRADRRKPPHGHLG